MIVLGSVLIVVGNVPGPHTVSLTVFVPLRYLVGWIAG